MVVRERRLPSYEHSAQIWSSWLGLNGDHVQFVSVLRHLKHAHPDWNNHVMSQRGKHSVLIGFADSVLIEGESEIVPAKYDGYVYHDWMECYKVYADAPSTKAVAFLRDKVKIEPIPELLRYRVPATTDEEFGQIREHVALLRFATFHYMGRTGYNTKDLDHGVAATIRNEIGIPCVVFSWDRKSPLHPLFPADHPIWRGQNPPDAATLIALMRVAEVNIGIDSGPQKIALALTDEGGPPCVAIWTGHHPIHYCDYAENTIHIVPVNHASKVRGDWSICRDFFESNYRYMVYRNVRELVDCTAQAVKELTQ